MFKKMVLVLLMCVFAVSCSNGCFSYTPAVKVSDSVPTSTPLNPSVDSLVPGVLGFSDNAEHIKETNVIVSRYRTPVCGGTVVRSDERMTLVLTACHCVSGDDETIMEWGMVSFNKDDSYRVRVLDINRDQDLALLQVTDPIKPKWVAPLALSLPSEKESIWVVGFGAGQEDIVSHGTIAMSDTFSQHTPKTHCIVIDASTYFGNSGGGIYNDDNELISVLIQNGPQHPDSGLWAYAVHLEELKKFITPYMN